MTAIDAIFDYYNSHLEDRAYVEATMTRFGCEELHNAACQILSEHAPPAPYMAGTFLRDIGTGILGDEIRSSFQHLLHSDQLLSVLVDGLDHSAWAVRENAVYTLGKLCLSSAVPAMVACFNRRVHYDPLLLEHLLFEIRWLETDDRAHALRVQTVVQSPEPLVRWSAIGLLKDHEDDIAHLQRLVTDSFSPLANEARFRLKSLEADSADDRL